MPLALSTVSISTCRYSCSTFVPRSIKSNNTIYQPRKDQTSLHDLIEECGFGTFQWLYLTLFGLIYLSDAAEIALSGIILSTLKCEWDLSSLEEGLIPFMVLVSYAIGSVVGL